jgi:predicted RNA-binding Zn-ribbon protein involved in translation (DUF1610 family)
MTSTSTTTRIVRMRCDGCGVQMNPHAEKPAAPVTAAEAARADWALGGLVEEIHHCPACGRVQSRRS